MPDEKKERFIKQHHLSAYEANILVSEKEISDYYEEVIKKSDKGSSTVIMDKKHYLTEGYRQLNNSLHYERIPQPLCPQIAPKMAIIL